MFHKALLRATQPRRFQLRMIALCAIVSIMIMPVAPPSLRAQGTVTVRVDTATRTVPVNGTFSADIVVDVGTEMDPNGLGAYEFDMVYDPNELGVISVSDAEELGETGRTVSKLGPTVDNETGRTTFAAYSYPPLDASGPKGTMVLARVTLRAHRPGWATLNLENALLTDTQANAWAEAQLDIQPGTIAVPMVVSSDYDDDNKTDIAIFVPVYGAWWISTSSSNFTSYISKGWGNSESVLVPGDYDGDGKTDIAIFNPVYGAWWICTSSSNFTSHISKQWGNSESVLVPGDYDGDGKTDIAIFVPVYGAWWISTSSSNFTSYISKQWGSSTSVPLWK
jgi:hypothetical protein